MQLTFLKAAMPLSKTITYSSRDDTFTMSHYPLAKRMTSNEVTVKDMTDFRDAIEDEGALGKCLLLGGLDRPLIDESRADHACKDWEHEWVCFDLDKVDAHPSLEGALSAIERYLPACVQRAECVIQLSPSCFNPRATKLSCHIFMKLSKPVKSAVLKDFLIWANFNGALAPFISLTENANALSYKVDRCVTDPSRLIYIAPPRMVGFENRMETSQWLAHFGGEADFTIPQFTPVTREQINTKINELRDEQGLERKEFRTVKFRGFDVLEGTEPGVISDVRASGGQYIRFNLNGGDSLAYFIDLKRPELIHNFKGEQAIFTKDVDDKFYKALVKTAQQVPIRSSIPESTEVLAFYATNRGSKVYVGTYDRASDNLRVDISSENAAASWLQQFGVPGKNILPHYDLTHDISSNVRYEEGYPVINLYERTNFMKQFGEASKHRDLEATIKEMDVLCPVIMKFARSITGDQRSCHGFINWLAFIFQYRVKTGTAWLLWGTEGSGKGKFLEHVCKPLLGQHSVGQVMMSNIDSQFNSLLEGKLLVNIDEAAMSRTRDTVEAMAKLRNYITEATLVINAKNITEREVPSFCNFIISSNDFKPVVLNPSDRRMHVGTRQETRLIPTPNEFATLVQGEELPHFARLLGELVVDEYWVRNPELTEQKIRLFESTHSLADSVAVAIQQGDTTFFFEGRPNPIQMGTSRDAMLLPIKQYDELLRGMLNGQLNMLTHEDLYVLFSVVINNPKGFPDNATAQRNIFNKYGLLGKKTQYCHRTQKSRYGIAAPTWQDVPDHLIEAIFPPMPAQSVADTQRIVPISKSAKKAKA